MFKIILCAVISGLLVVQVDSHGRLIEPPSRSTMWRYGFSTPPNYNDHELYCGGFTRQYQVNGGKCGICGDPWDTKPPRANEAGGLYGKGIIVRKYEKDSIIKVRVELTANHMGYFEFRICPNNNPTRAASQKCLDQYRLYNSNNGHPKFFPGPGNRVFELHYQLPKGLTCRQCVFQWRYVAGNNWGTCPNGTETVGCGPQEEFRACADIAITEADGSANEIPNLLFDDEVFVPPLDSPTDYHEIDTNEIDVNSDDHVDDYNIEQQVEIESVIFIVFATLLFTVMFFGGLIFYYVRGKNLLHKFSMNHDWAPDWNLPSMGKLPSVSMPRAIKNATSNFNWPLSNIQIKSLPNFLKKNSVTSNEPVFTPSTRSQVTSASSMLSSLPRPPPRIKKSQISSVRVATIAPRQHQGVRPPPHPTTAPPPPPTMSTNNGALEIGSPIAVTINGVSVQHTDHASDLKNPKNTSFIVPAKMVLANEDIPDSMEHRPPPLPKNPPPEDDEIALP